MLAYKILRKCEKTDGVTLLKSPAGCTLGGKESAELLINTFFPMDTCEDDTEEQTLLRDTVDSSYNALISEPGNGECRLLFTHTEVQTVLNNMSPKKAPGGDGLTSDICHKAYAANTGGYAGNVQPVP